MKPRRNLAEALAAAAAPFEAEEADRPPDHRESPDHQQHAQVGPWGR